MESAIIQRKVIFPLNFIVFISLACIAVFLTGCKKDSQDDTVRLASLEGRVLHHNVEIQKGIVYIKQNAIEFPGISPAIYDDSIRFHSPPSAYKFKNLKAGDYYLYCKGYDYFFQDSVFGGIPVSLSAGESKTIDIAVTE